MTMELSAIARIAAALVSALLIAFITTPVVKSLAQIVGAVDVPKDGRRMHDHPIPRMGGLAIFLGFLLSTLLFVPMSSSLRGMLLGGVIIVILGIFDDIYALPAKPKLVVQIVAALVAVLHGNVIQVLSNPNIFSDNPYWVLGKLAVPLSVIWIVAITNAVNLIDGLDGLAVGVATISSLTMLVIAMLVSESGVALLMAALAGGCIGFMPYNLNPAKIFMGDTGSTFLGFVLATVSIQGLFKFYTIISFAVPFLMLGLPLFDTCFAILRRIAKGQSPMAPDRSHVHHRLIDMGFNQKQAVAILYVISAILGLSAVVLTTSGALKAMILLCALCLAGLIAGKIFLSHNEGRHEKTEEKKEMPMPLKVMTIFGTRPEAVKMAPLVKELESRPEIQSICCITAQHRQMLDDVLHLFDITPDYDLDIMEARQSLYTITSKCLLGMEEVFSQEKPDLVLVHGDTTTTFSGALAAFYQKIAVGHVEAGLRTWDRYSPFPEEMNRTLVGDLAQLHFCPTKANRENLAGEGIKDGVFITGNTVIDALKTTVRPDYEFRTELLNELDYTGKKVILVTCHRRENYGEPMEHIMKALRRIAEDFPQTELVYPVHLSPVVQEVAKKYLSGHPRIHLIQPLTPDEMHNLMARATFVMTDSGGLQEEAPALGRPVLVLRRETERPEAVTAGTVLLAGTEEEAVYQHAAKLLTDPAAYEAMAKAVNPYGDGQACRRIVDAILWNAGLRNQPPEEFLV